MALSVLQIARVARGVLRRSAMRASRILVVVEDDALGELVGEALLEEGHAVVRADGRGRVEQALRDGEFDAAIVDLDTRGLGGAAVIALLRDRAPSTRVIALLPCGGTARCV